MPAEKKRKINNYKPIVRRENGTAECSASSPDLLYKQYEKGMGHEKRIYEKNFLTGLHCGIMIPSDAKVVKHISALWSYRGRYMFHYFYRMKAAGIEAAK